MDFKDRQQQKAQLDWRWRKLNRVPMTSKEFNWLEWELLTDDYADWHCKGPVMQGVLTRILKKRREKGDTANGNL